MSLHRIFLAGFVRRWHTNPDLCHTCDRVDGHAARVARFLIYLWPQSRLEVLRAALIHDDGEIAVGDMSTTVKNRRPDIAYGLAEIEAAEINAIWGTPDSLTIDETDRIKFCDRLDAFLWAKHHAPHVLDDDGWPEAQRWLQAQAYRLGVSDKVWFWTGGL